MINVLFRVLKKFKDHGVIKHGRVTLFFISMILYSATGFLFFELPENPDLNFGDALWWTIVTMTTVGYGDFFPTTMAGRLLVGFPTMILGVSCLGYVLSLVATLIIESKMEELKGMKTITVRDHIVVCGFVSLEKILKILEELRRDSSTEDRDVVLIDENLEEIPAELKAVDGKLHFVKGEPGRHTVLEQANVTEAHAIILPADTSDPENSDNAHLRTALTLKAMAPSVYTVVECLDPETEVFFHRAGIDSTVCLANLTGQMLIQELQDPGVGTIISELTSNQHGKQFYLCDVPKNCTNYGDVLDHYDLDTALALGIRRGEENLLLPEKTLALQGKDRVILVSSGRPS